jgi:hypothetical protein
MEDHKVLRKYPREETMATIYTPHDKSETYTSFLGAQSLRQDFDDQFCRN